jgi:hypothetical protein
MEGSTMNYRKIALIILVLVFVFSLGTFTYATDVQNRTQRDFKDVGNKYGWAKDAIGYFSQHNIVNGNPDGNFHPEDNITREQFAKILSLTFNEPLAEKNGAKTFADVPSDRWSYSYIESVKYYLTGYYPTKGKPIFDPSGDAVREDIAVALVKMMGYKYEDLKDPNILEEKFTDANEVSPNLKTLVAIAVEKGLMKGSNGMLRPQAPITRAEAVVLLYRGTKSSVDNANQDLMLQVEAPEQVSTPVVNITGITEPGAAVTINQESVQADVYGRFEIQYTLKNKGNYKYVIEAQKDTRKASVEKDVSYGISGPELQIDELSDKTRTNSITVSGSVYDNNDLNPLVYINGNLVQVKGDGSWSAEVSLSQGLNTITVEAVNNSGKKTTMTKEITFKSRSSEQIRTDDSESNDEGQNIGLDERHNSNYNNSRFHGRYNRNKDNQD